MCDPRPALDQAAQFAVGKVDGVGEDRPLAEAAGPVVDVDVVLRLREEPCDLGDLAAVLGDVGLPVRPGRSGEGCGFAQQLRRTRDGEPRCDGIAKTVAVGAVPARDEVGGLAQ